jgi:hypothetical protein
VGEAATLRAFSWRLLPGEWQRLDRPHHFPDAMLTRGREWRLLSWSHSLCWQHDETRGVSCRAARPSSLGAMTKVKFPLVGVLKRELRACAWEKCSREGLANAHSGLMSVRCFKTVGTMSTVDVQVTAPLAARGLLVRAITLDEAPRSVAERHTRAHATPSPHVVIDFKSSCVVG